MLPGINLFHVTLPVALLFVGDWMTPTPYNRAHPFHGGRKGHHCFIYIQIYLTFPALSYWSSFQIMILTFILVSYWSIHACLFWNQLSLSFFILFQHTCLSCLKSTFFILPYQLHCCCLEVGWPPPLPKAHPFHRGEGGVDGLWPWPWQGGGGGLWTAVKVCCSRCCKSRASTGDIRPSRGGDPEPGTYILII